MAFPTVQKFSAAGMLVNQRIAFVSLLTTTGTYVTGITNQKIARGYTCAGSSNGVTAAMDGVNRCTNAAGFAVRGANTTTAQSWIVTTAANGAQTLFAFTGATDDVVRVSGSPGGLFVVAGTPTFAPTATDECVGTTANTVIGNQASGDRVFTVQIDAAHNGWRAFIFRAGVLNGPLLWGELFDPAFIVAPTTCAVPVWYGALTTANVNAMSNAAGAYSASNSGGATRMVVGGTPTTINMGGSNKILGNSQTAQDNTAQELNGGLFVIRTVGVSSVTSGARGDVGNRFDWAFSNEFKACGELDTTKTWVLLNTAAAAGTSGGVLWTWDGVSAVTTT